MPITFGSRCFATVAASGKTLRTLREAIAYLGKTVPKSERDHPAVVLASTVLTGAAEGRDFVMHARSAVYRALTRNDPPPAQDIGPQAPRKKSARKYRIIR
jgi:hypothetical protein